MLLLLWPYSSGLLTLKRLGKEIDCSKVVTLRVGVSVRGAVIDFGAGAAEVRRHFRGIG